MPALPPGKKTSLRFIRAQGPPLPSSHAPSPAPHKVSLGACSGERRPLGGDRHCPAQPQDHSLSQQGAGEAPSAQSPSSPDTQPEVAPHLVGMPAMLPRIPSMCSALWAKCQPRPCLVPTLFFRGKLPGEAVGVQRRSQEGPLSSPLGGTGHHRSGTLGLLHTLSCSFPSWCIRPPGLGFLVTSREHVPTWVFVTVASGLLFKHHASIERLLHARN